jgi:hypothetical protein
VARSTAYSEPLSIDSLTRINLSSLARVVKEYGDASGVFTRIDAAAVPHIKRCIRAGAVEAAGAAGSWRVSAAGRAALANAGLAGMRRRR